MQRCWLGLWLGGCLDVLRGGGLGSVARFDALAGLGLLQGRWVPAGGRRDRC